jgi:hypothetical protein
MAGQDPACRGRTTFEEKISRWNGSAGMDYGSHLEELYSIIQF